MPEGSQQGSQRSLINTDTWPSEKMMSSGEGGGFSSCTSVNTVSSDGDHPTSLSSSTSSVSLQEASHSSSSSSSSSSSLPYVTELPFNESTSSSSSSSSMQKRNGSDISLDLRPLVTREPEPTSTRQLTRLERVMLEIVETEEAYVRDLKSIVEDYLGPIMDCKPSLLSSEDVNTLFCNIEDIYQFNRELLQDLRRSHQAAAIAECFVERCEDFDIYTLYCMNYPSCVSLLRLCLQNDIIFRFFNDTQTSLNQSLPVETYLLKPVQRILKYHLLLQELCRHVDPADPDVEVVEEALVTMTAVAWYINDMKRRQELSIRLKEIEGLLVNWSGPDLCGFGDLLLEGCFRVQKVKKERVFFLFEKVLLITKKKLHQFIYSSHIFCCNLALVETLKDPLSFRVSDQNILKHQHTVQTKNQEEKRLWVHFLKKVMEANHPASLPHKARRLLGSQCESQLDLDHQSSPRPDHSPAYLRNRRHSEPQNLLLSTPERGRRGRHPLLDRTLSHRHRRRQSDPADLKQSNSETDLQMSAADNDFTSCPQVTVKPPGDQLGEQVDEDLTFVTSPVLSITEEILEIINQQTRNRERPNSAPEPALTHLQTFTAVATQDDGGTDSHQEQLESVQKPLQELDLTTFLQPVSADHDPSTFLQEPSLTPDMQEKDPETLQTQENNEDQSGPVIGQSGSQGQVEPSETVSPTTTLPKDQSHDTDLTSNNALQSMHELAIPAPQLDEAQTPTVGTHVTSAMSREDEGLSVVQVQSEVNTSSGLSDCEEEINTSGPNKQSADMDPTSFTGQTDPNSNPGAPTFSEENGSLKPPENTETLDSKKESIEQIVPENHKTTVLDPPSVEIKSVVEGRARPDSTHTNKNETREGWSSRAKIEPRIIHEDLGSYLEDIRLFESSTADDCNPALVQNSKRILNRVQTLARMYSTRNSALKVPLDQRSRGAQSSGSVTRSDPDLLISKTGTLRNKTNTKQYLENQHQKQILTLNQDVSIPDGQQGSLSPLSVQHVQQQRVTLSRPRDFLTLIKAESSSTDVQRLQSQSWSQRKNNVSKEPREPAFKRVQQDLGCHTHKPSSGAMSDKNQRDLQTFASSTDLKQNHTQTELRLVNHELYRTKEKPTSTEATRSPLDLHTLDSQKPDPRKTREKCIAPQGSRDPNQSDRGFSTKIPSYSCRDSSQLESRVLEGSHATSMSDLSFSRRPSAFQTRMNASTKPLEPHTPSTFTRSLAASFISQSINQSIAKMNSGHNIPSLCQELLPPTQLSKSDSQNSHIGRAHILQVKQDCSNPSGQVPVDPFCYPVALPCAASKNTFTGHTPLKSKCSPVNNNNSRFSNKAECLPEHNSRTYHPHVLTLEPLGITGSSSRSLSPCQIGLPPLADDILAPQPKRLTTQPQSQLCGSHLSPSAFRSLSAPGSPPSPGEFVVLQKPTSPISTMGQGQNKVGFKSLIGGPCSRGDYPFCHRTNSLSPTIQLDAGGYIGSDSRIGPQEMFSSTVLQEQPPDEGNCRSQVICPYVMRSCQEKNPSSLPVKACLDAIRPPDSSASPSSENSSSPLTASKPPLSKPTNMRASYATTVNLQITSRGCITSFSTAHLSHSQNLQINKVSRGASGEATQKVRGCSGLPQL